MNPGLLIVVPAPQVVEGYCCVLVRNGTGMWFFPFSATSRSPRPGEIDGA